MSDKVFTTFKVWDNGTMSKLQVLDLAYEQFEDIKDTFDLDKFSCVRQVKCEKESGGKVYTFEIRQPGRIKKH